MVTKDKACGWVPKGSNFGSERVKLWFRKGQIEFDKSWFLIGQINSPYQEPVDGFLIRQTFGS